jgi:hypothetical protein
MDWSEMPEFGRRVVTGARQWLAAAAIGAIGAPLVLWFLAFVWPSVNATTPAMGSLPVIVMLAMPVGLLAGTVATGIGGFIALWIGAFAATSAVVLQYADGGYAAIAAALSVLVIPQGILAGYVLARLVGRAITDRGWTTPTRVVATWLVPSLALFSVIGLIGIVSGVTLRASRQSSCPPLASTIALSGKIVFAGSHALCIANLENRSVRQVYGSPTEFDETLDSVRWSTDGRMIAAIRERRPRTRRRTASPGHIRSGRPTDTPSRSASTRPMSCRTRSRSCPPRVAPSRS